ncbi:MAG TPA: hypothetical protein VGB87_05265, partial [Vicinamibacteria bacterium]
ALAVWRGREVCASPARAFLLCTVLWTLAVYTFFRVDTPFNYYASRYFLPVLVPATLLLLGSVLGHFRPPRGGLALLALVAAWTAWRGYQLGWTDRFTQPLAVGAWSSRAQYAAQGWPSVAHLDIVSMVLATSVVGLPVVLALAVWRGREVCASPARAFLLCTVLWTLAVYTFFRVDTPVNYYASRYFLPVLVPATLLLLGSLLGHVPPPRGGTVLLALVALGFNLTFDLGLLRYPSETEKMGFVEEVARRAEGKRVLFVRAGEPIHRLLAVLLPSLRGIEVVRVAHLRGQPETTLIERYAAALGLADAAVLSTVSPPAGRAYTELSLVERRFVQQGIVYPTDHLEGRRSYYVYELVFARDEGGTAVPPP